MSQYAFTTVARSNEQQGKGASRRLRKENLVPAIIYGGKGEPTSVAIKYNELVRALEDEAFFASILDLDVAGTKEEVIIKALQRHPSKGVPLHVDFQRIVRGQAMHFTVPVHFVGTAKGTKVGGVLQTNVTELEINCLPRQLPEFIEVDVSALEVGDLIRFSDIKLADGITIVDLDNNATDRVVVSVQAPTVTEEELEAEAEAALEAGKEAGKDPEDAAAGEDQAEENKEDKE